MTSVRNSLRHNPAFRAARAVFPLARCRVLNPAPSIPISASQGPENTDLSFHFAAKDIPSMMNDVKCLLLLAKVYKTQRKEDVVETLNKVIDKRMQAPFCHFSMGAVKGRVGHRSERLQAWSSKGEQVPPLHFIPTPLRIHPVVVRQPALSLWGWAEEAGACEGL